LKYLYDGWNLIAELNGNSGNALVRSYTWGLDLSGTAQGAGGVGGLLMVNAGSGGVHFPAYDLNGNVMGLVNATNGNISAKYEYGPFGEVFCSVGDMAKVNPFGFSTKYTDFETDLLYYGYRYYSPSLGRWLSRDPIEERGGLNLYGFVNNDPVNKWDRLGLSDEEFSDSCQLQLLKLLLKIKQAKDLIEKGKCPLNPCMSVISLRAQCDCFFRDFYDENKILGCFCLTNGSEDCYRKAGNFIKKYKNKLRGK